VLLVRMKAENTRTLGDLV